MLEDYRAIIELDMLRMRPNRNPFLLNLLNVWSSDLCYPTNITSMTFIADFGGVKQESKSVTSKADYKGSRAQHVAICADLIVL